MGIFSFLGIWSPVHIHAVNLLTGAKRVGRDSTGNTYYRAKPRKGYKLERRWVIYKDTPEASNVPPEWHGWLHHQTNDIPANDKKSFRRKWQKPHQQNLTGTAQAYHPPSAEKRDTVIGDYNAWQPE